MKLTGFFKTPKHRVFNYKPRYYNPEEEELEQKLKQKQAENFVKDEKIKIRRHIELRRSEEKKAYGRRLLIISIIFVLLFIILFYGFKMVYLLK